MLKLKTRSYFSALCGLCLIVSLSGCFRSKVDLPTEAPQVVAVVPAATSGAGSSDDRTVTVASTQAVTTVANTAGTSVAAATATELRSTAAAGTPSTDAVTRVSGQVNSGKQGQASFKIAGHIARTVVQVGERVRKGQVLAVLDDIDAQLRLKLAQNQFEQSKVTFEQARKDLQREEQLKKEGATTQSNFERISNALSAARIAQAQAQISLQQAEKAVADTKLVAAFDGVVSRRLKVEGEYVGVGAAVFEVASMRELEVSLRVPENLIRKVKPGHRVNLSIPSLGRAVDAQILRIVPVIQENSRTFEVIGRVLESSAGEIIPGQFVEAQF